MRPSHVNAVDRYLSRPGCPHYEVHVAWRTTSRKIARALIGSVTRIVIRIGVLGIAVRIPIGTVRIGVAIVVIGIVVPPAIIVRVPVAIPITWAVISAVPAASPPGVVAAIHAIYPNTCIPSSSTTAAASLRLSRVCY
jgi:hypothetical protein